MLQIFERCFPATCSFFLDGSSDDLHARKRGTMVKLDDELHFEQPRFHDEGIPNQYRQSVGQLAHQKPRALNQLLALLRHYSWILPKAEHSMCHPGLPWPQGAPQTGSPGLVAFHRTKSRFSSLPRDKHPDALCWGTEAGRNFGYLKPLRIYSAMEKYTDPSDAR